MSILADPALPLVADLRSRFGGPIIANSGFSSVTTLEDVNSVLENDYADAVAVGREFIANPDLAERWKIGAELNEPDGDTVYGGGVEGYTDYPTLDETQEQHSA